MSQSTPIGFASVRGHASAIAFLLAATRQGHLAHALMFAGADGIGKRAVAMGYAAWLLCEAPTDDACGTCPSCRLVAAASHPDLQVVGIPAGKKEIGVDRARELKRFAQLRALHGRSKIIVIDDAQALNVSAQNALLKTLEEPPPSSQFILVVNNPDAMLPTVRSRCQRLAFAPLDATTVVEVLRANGLDAALADELAALCEGSPGRALLLRDSTEAGARARLLSLLADVGGARYCRLMQVADALSRPEGELPIKLELLMGALRDGARAAAEGDDPAHAEADLQRAAAVLDTWTALQRTHPNRSLLVDSLLLRLGRI